MPVPDSVTQLVQRFTDNRAQYLQTHFNETQTRIDFVNPFFAALGWDMDNAAGLPEAYRQVVHEDALKIERTVKAPDYSFRLGGQRKYFLETKKPSVVINLSRDSAYQLRRYAWTANLPVSLLCSFDELAVYDGRIAPTKDDSPTKARLEFYKYTDYLEKWDELYSRFSREAVEGGAFDRYAEEEVPLFRGRQRVDAAFLATIEGWRKSLAEALTQGNPSLSPRDLNRTVQTIIDRILFLRICEARGVEAEYKLQPAANGANVYPRLLQLFRHADDRYNSGLFHFKPEAGRGDYDTLTPHLKVGDKPLKDIIASLYYPESPFEFSVMPADILGQVYEQFLGKVIRVDGGHALVEEKPEVRKAGGVFYTPTYIVDYIVRQTVGRLVEGKTPKQAASITVLDPACGSGSFLIGAYQFLLDWHVNWYVNDGPAKHAKGKNAVLYEGPNHAWRLTTAERKRILRGCIYGVDIDAQAVEVTKLSLLLKMLEGESAQVVDLNLSMFKERALPDMDANIKCGNSLIGSDFYDTQDRALFDVETQLRINTFDWDAEFAVIMGKGGFSAVIGNPPYVSFGLRDVGTLTASEGGYYRSRFANSAEYKISLYAVFMQAAIDLVQNGGMTSFIVPDSFLLGRYFSKLRRYTLHKCSVKNLLMIKARVFATATVGTSVIFTFKKQADKDNTVHVALCTDTQQFAKDAFVQNSYSQSSFEKVEHNRFRLFFRPTEKALVDTVEQVPSVKLAGIVKLSSGLIGKQGKDNIVSSKQTGPLWQRGLLSGEEVRKYAITYKGNYINFDHSELKSGFKDARYSEPKLLGRQTGDTLIWGYDEENLLCLNNLHVGNTLDTPYSLKYVLAILNSRMMNFYYSLIALELGRALAQTDIETLDTLPIRAIDFDSPADKKQHDQLVSLVEQMLSLHRALPAQTDPAARTLTTRALAATDAKIDALVYALYNLSPAEIDLVEGRVPPEPDAAP